MNSDEISDWRRKRLALIAEEMGGSSKLGAEIGHKTGVQIRQMTAGRRSISDKTMDEIEALPGREGWFQRDGGSPEGRDLLGCLRYLREALEMLEPADRQMARIALKHFIDNPDELLEVATAVQALPSARLER